MRADQQLVRLADLNGGFFVRGRDETVPEFEDRILKREQWNDDADGDSKLARYWFGLPREGIGFSNDAMAHITYPRFSVAAFDHGEAAQHVPVTLRYFLR